MTDFRHPQPLTDEQEQLLNNVKVDILKEAETFFMGAVFNDCDTPACIAGHCIIRLGFSERGTLSSLLKMEEYFQIPEDEDMKLFYAMFWEADLYERYGNLEGGTGAQVAIEAITRYVENTRAHFANESEA